MNRLAALLAPVIDACESPFLHAEKDEDITSVYQQLKALRPAMEKEMKEIEALARSQALNSRDAEKMRGKLLHLIDMPDEFVLPQ